MPQKPLPKFLHLGIPFHDLGLEPWIESQSPLAPMFIGDAVKVVHDGLDLARKIAVNTLPHPTAADVLAVYRLIEEERKVIHAERIAEARREAGPKAD
jgi:hypothetical protein